MAHSPALSKLVDTLIKENASDLHLSEGRQPYVRVAGFLVPLTQEAVLTRAAIQSFLGEMISKEQYARFEEDKELDFSFAYGEQARFRGNAFIQQGHVGIALRLIPKIIRTLERLLRSLR
jgi:twitching motility protein PilT